MLTTAMLKAASAYEARKMSHDILPKLTQLVESYNILAAGARQIAMHDRAMRLQEIMLLAGKYLTLKPPQDQKDTDGSPLHTKNMRRWIAMQQLAEDAVREASDNGILLVRGPANMRNVTEQKASIWLEVIDEKHRHGAVLSGRYEAWLKDPNCRQNKTSFWNYLDSNSTPSELDDLHSNQVTYGGDEAEQARVVFNEKNLMTDLHGHPIDTWTMRTVESGPHWGIFVYTTDEKMYVHSHRGGEFHHTSFTGGKPVIAGGEMVVSNGEIKILTAKTGHYWCPIQQIHAMVVRMMPGQLSEDAIIRPWMLDTSSRDKGGAETDWWLTCKQFRDWGPRVPIANGALVSPNVPLLQEDEVSRAFSACGLNYKPPS